MWLRDGAEPPVPPPSTFLLHSSRPGLLQPQLLHEKCGRDLPGEVGAGGAPLGWPGMRTACSHLASVLTSPRVPSCSGRVGVDGTRGNLGTEKLCETGADPVPASRWQQLQKEGDESCLAPFLNTVPAAVHVSMPSSGQQDLICRPQPVLGKHPAFLLLEQTPGLLQLPRSLTAPCDTFPSRSLQCSALREHPPSILLGD